MKRNLTWISKLLYETRIEIGKTTANLFDKSFDSGSILRDWKDAIVVPHFKKGSKSLPVGLPVSLTSIVCKVI